MHHRIIDEVLRRTVKHDPSRLEDLSLIGDGPKPRVKLHLFRQDLQDLQDNFVLV